MAEIIPKEQLHEVLSSNKGEKYEINEKLVNEQSCCQTFVSQTRILTVKNFQIQRRFLAATLAQFCVGVGNGTDALEIAMDQRAEDVGKRDLAVPLQERP